MLNEGDNAQLRRPFYENIASAKWPGWPRVRHGRAGVIGRSSIKLAAEENQAWPVA